MDLLSCLCYKLIMRKLLILLGIMGVVIGTPAFANEGEEIQLGAVEQAKIELPKVDYKDKESLVISDKEIMDEIIKLQREKDMEDIENLWKGTVENNQVIGFALKKLSTPESQRRIHSSLMAKTLSAIVSGASFVPSLMGANPAIQTSAFSAGRLAQGLLNKKNVPQETPLTDTELIELAGMVEDLQDTLISSYYNYKNTLMQLKATRSKMLLYSRNYNNALYGNDIMETAISTNLYDSMRLREFELEQSAKKYHIQLQRLAGKKAVDSLEMHQYDFDSILYKNSKEERK